MNFWNQAFFERSTKVLTQKCLDIIKKDRDGEQVDENLLKNVIQSYGNVFFLMMTTISHHHLCIVYLF